MGRVRHPQTQGKVERFHGSLARALARRGPAAGEQAAWLERFRWEYNHVRPHQALGMKTRPACGHAPNARMIPAKPAWVYPEGSWTLKVDCQGKLDIKGQHWRVGKALQGERVRIEQVEQRLLVFYCTTLIREIDLVIQRSTMVERWITGPLPPPQM